ncbi:filamentous hemagglutinin family outer membrane protein [Pantoea ananatis LMG 5342]|uniref:hemagglutinin repeat-containing protein n=2 Tax=Erwiniaceae TaxID=1903409 RepID=UPI0002417AA3|nr:hemagglutinin repeat-containing protein [Pantoea ananatis]CCF10792.1 filamentous hemagglutinin family outer membrane protein [Pantoea ananatis LMG 5342]
MDDRQPVSPARRALSYLICYLVAVQPMLPVMAAEITPVTPGTRMDAAGNGVPVVNIATPNQAGVSHNQYDQYNVGQQGLILNNATGQLTQTQLGGLIQNNPNLKAGQEARAIINEVVGANRSQLQGYTEVAGKAANVMVANPYGITCNGCGFINTPNVTLTTGKPQFDANGNLAALEVSKGTITIEGQGLDGSKADAVSIVARATEINAGIHAKDLTVTLGANRVGQDGSITPINGEGPAPGVAVDTSALGGMYANRIHLVSSEKGVGVNLGNLLARQGDITLDANGKLAVHNSLSSGALTASAQSVELSGEHKSAGPATITAQNTISLHDGSLGSDRTIALQGGKRLQINSGKIVAGDSINLAATSLSLDNGSALNATNNISFNAQPDFTGGLSLDPAGQFDNAGQFTAGNNLSLNAFTIGNTGSLSAKGQLSTVSNNVTNQGALQGNAIRLKSDALNNSGTLQGADALTLETMTLNNSGSLTAPQLTLNSDAITNSGLLQGTQNLTLLSQHLTNLKKGSIATAGDLTLNLPDFSNSGLLSTGGALHLSGNSLVNDGEINASTLHSDNGQLTNLTDGKLLATGSLQLTNDQLTNGGQIAANQSELTAATLNNAGRIQGASSLNLNADTTNNRQGGELLTSGQLTLNGGDLNNAGLIQADKLALTVGNWQNSGNALSAGDATLKAKTLTNSGKILGQQSIDLQGNTTDNSGWLLAKVLAFQGDLINSGLIQGDTALTLKGGSLSNQATGQLQTAGNADITASSLNNQGQLQGDNLAVTAQRWQNSGSAQATKNITASVAGELNNGGTLTAQQAMNLQAGKVTNAGTLAADQLTIQAPQLSNAGLIQGNSALAITSAQIANLANGRLVSGSGLSLAPVQLVNDGLLQVAGTFSVNGGDFTNNGQVNADALNTALTGTLNNGVNGKLLARQLAQVQAQSLTNAGSVAGQQLQITGDTLQNQGLLQGDNALTAGFRQLDNLAGGQLITGGALTLQGTDARNAGTWQGSQLSYRFGSLKNTGTLNGTGALDGQTTGLLDNSGNLITGGNASLNAESLTNSGKIMASGLTLRAGSLNNSGLWQGTTSLDALSTGDLTQSSTGRALSGGDLLLGAATLNTAGTLQGVNAEITSGSWQNQGSLLSTGDLSAAIDSNLTNGGSLLSQGGAQLSAQNLVNTGSVLAEKAMTLNGGSLNNSGAIQGDTLSVTPASVTNQGNLIGLKSLTLGPAPQRFRMLLAQSAPTRELVNNAGGQLLTQGALTITADNVTNNGSWQGQQILLNAAKLANGGAIQSADGLQLTLSDRLDAAAGSKISANGTAALQALTLANQGQWVAKNLTLKGDTLNNNGDITGADSLSVQLNGALTQQQDKNLLSAGKISLQSASLNNLGRIQGSELQINTGALDNAGRLQGDNNLLLSATGHLTNAANGTLVSQNALTLTAPALYNYGLIQGAGGTVNATNSATNNGRLLAGGALTFTTSQLVNNGWLQAGQLTLNASGLINNGTLLADQQGTLNGTNFQNQGMAQGGNLAVNYQNLGNSGTVLGTGQLNVNAAQVNLTGSGRLFSGGGLTLVSNGFDQFGQVVALGDVLVNLANSFVSHNTLAAGNRLTLNSNGSLENQSTMQGQGVTLNAGGDLTNNGQITTGGADSSLTGNSIAMNGAGSLQGGGSVTLNSRSDVTLDGFTGTLGNLTISTPGRLVNTALLYAGQNLYLFANSIRNQRGDILAGNSLWMQRDGAGNANGEVINTSGTIETQGGDININTGHLLNTRDGLTTGSSTVAGPGLPSGAEKGSFEIKLSELSVENGELGFFHEIGFGGNGDGGGSTPDRYTLLPTEKARVKRYLVSQTTISAFSNGGAARIAAGRNLAISASLLDNQASNLLAGKDITLSGRELNNASWNNGVTSEYLSFALDPNTTLASQDQLIVRAKPNQEYLNGSNYEYYEPDQNNGYQTNSTEDKVKYILSGSPEYVTTPTGNGLRAIIQAGGNVNANFSSNISNTNTTSNAGWSGNTISTPGLRGLASLNQAGAQQRQQIAGTDKVTVNSPQWRDQLQGALQQVNGDSSLDNSTPDKASLVTHASGNFSRADLSQSGRLISDPSISSANLRSYKPASVDTSAYPIPSGDNGYFVFGNSKSPYLITLNPKLNGLGQLDNSLFGDLNALLGRQPGQAPQENRQLYTDKTTFLGSSYLLDRLNLKPNYDYRFLVDAAFDTRYVSNVVLNQTGSRYLNGIGSELDQMRYLMDNAASAQRALGLQFGVSLSAQQVASLDKSMVWWEATTINGETVMVPKVYLSSKDVEMHDGSVIAGNNVTLSGGDITNSGSTVTAKNNLTVSSQNSVNNLNAGMLYAGENLQLTAINNINNVSSSISGQKVALESVNGDINNTTATTLWQMNASSNERNIVTAKQTFVGPTATITSLGSLSLKSGNDINIKGANLSAGGDLLINAWHDIAITNNQVTSGLAFQNSGNQKVTNTASQISAGHNLSVQSGHDLNVTASNLNAANDATLKAGNDLNLNSATNTQNNRSGNQESHSTGLDRTAVSSGGNLSLAAGQDINSQAAAIAATGNAALKAGRDINLNAEATGSGYSERGDKKTVISETVRQQGTEIASGGSTTMVAGRDINTEATDVTAKQDIALQAGRDVNLNTATESDYYYKEETKTKKGFLSKKTTHTIQEDSATNEKGTLLSGNNVSVKAGNDLLVKGSQVVGDGNVALDAGNNVDIAAATNTDSTWRFSETKKSGLMGTGGIGISIGSSKSLQEMRDKGTTQSQSISTVGSTKGNVSITAGKQLQVNGADLVAGGNMALQGDSVTVTPGHDLRTHDERTEQRTSGLTLALSGAVAEAVNSAVAAAQSAKQQSDGRLAALQATKAVLSGVQANQASQLAQVQGDPNNGIGISISLSTQQSKSEQHQQSDTVNGSTINAGRNLSINATGKGQGRDSGNLVISGSQLKAGGDTTLQAANDITLTGAANTQQTTGKNSSSGGGIGVSFGVGAGSAGLSVFASVNGAKGNEKGNGTVWSETTLDSGGKVAISSGRDTTLSGAQVNGNSVKADVGRDLTITSLQDSDKYDSKQSSFGAGGSFTFGSMTGSGYINASQDKMHSNFDSVKEQSGLYAGNGGFDVTVGNHTQLNGAVIASQADADKNRLDTGTLGFTNLHNEADYKTEHQGIGMSSGASFGGQFAGNMANTMLAGAGGKGHAEGTTQSAVANGTIVVRDQANQKQDTATLSRDTAHANDSISPIFNKEKEQQRLQTAQMIGEIGSQVADIARTQGEIYALKKAQEVKGPPPEGASEKARNAYIESLKATPEYKKAIADSDSGTGSSLQQGIQAATAAVQGLAGGDFKAALAGASAPYLAELIHKNTTTTGPDGKPVVNTAANLMAHAVVGAVIAQAQGNSALSGASGAALGEFIAQEMYPGIARTDLSEEQKQTISALGTLAAGLAGGLANGSASGAIAGAQAGKNAVENNSLADIAQAQSEGKTLEQKANEQVEAENDRYKKANCGGMSAEACSVKMYQERREALKETVSLGADFVPIVGDIKSFAEAQSAADYLAAVIGIIPGAGDAAGKIIKAAEAALKNGDVAEASKLINKASEEIQAVKPLDVGSYKELKDRSVVGDGLEHDHIPSFAAIRQAKENELGRKLTPTEEKNLYNNATAIEVPKDVHQAGRTYGGKNTPSQIKQDAIDLCGAECRDTEVHRKNMLDRGYDPKIVDDAIMEIKKRNSQTGVTKIMLIWDEFVNLLGRSKFDVKFVNISSDFHELPNIEESVLGDRKYYSFLQSGVLFLLEGEVIDQITFYTTKDESFSEYKGELPLSTDSSEDEAMQILGHPLDSGGGKIDPLMGHIDRWIRYENEGYTLHLQFNQNDRLSRITLMR